MSDREIEPLWREEFPFTSAGEESIARRDFARYVLAASGVFAVGTAGAAVWAGLQRTNTGSPRPIVELSEVPEGTEHLFKYPSDDDPAILVHLPGGELRAFSQKCTHLGCVVFWQADEDRLFCPCHEGVFDPVTGDPTAGPPERPLGRIDTEVRDGVIWALGAEVGGLE
ncbi:MAG: ubiquinol-cytochrome c reductase iron-sulfur subunit [Microthrixaceae bacterium]